MRRRKTVKKPDDDGYKRITMGSWQIEQNVYNCNELIVRCNSFIIAINSGWVEGKFKAIVYPAIKTENKNILEVKPTSTFPDLWKVRPEFESGKFVNISNPVNNNIAKHMEITQDPDLKDVIKQELEKLRMVSHGN